MATSPAANNRAAARLAEDWQKAAVGGSDAHTLGTLALTYTEVAGGRRRAVLPGSVSGTDAGKWRAPPAATPS